MWHYAAQPDALSSEGMPRIYSHTWPHVRSNDRNHKHIAEFMDIHSARRFAMQHPESEWRNQTPPEFVEMMELHLKGDLTCSHLIYPDWSPDTNG